jgi:hypothetical protein
LTMHFYDGTRNFMFKQYCELLNQAFTDIESTGERVDETHKVCVLLQGITDSRLSNAKTQILATPTLKDIFEHAVNFLNQFLDKKRSFSRGKKQVGNNSPRNVSATNIKIGLQPVTVIIIIVRADTKVEIRNGRKEIIIKPMQPI